MANSDKRQKGSSHIPEKVFIFFPLQCIHCPLCIFIYIYSCSYTSVAEAYGSMLTEVAGKEQMSLTKQHEGVSSLLLLLYFLKASEGIKQMNSFFSLSHWDTLNWLPVPVLL